MLMTPSRKEKMEQVAGKRQAGFCVVIEDIHDPHNAAAIMRTCDAFGVQDVRFVFTKQKAYNPRRIGKASSSSANKWLSITRSIDVAATIKELKDEEYTILVTALGKEAVDPYVSDLTQKKVALIVGNEHEGVSEAFLAAADLVLTIPMCGFVESLNVSVATALLIAEISRQRAGTNLLSPADQDALFVQWQK